MDTALFIHILAASLGLVSGFVALYAGKGATLHRKAGMVFVCAILAMFGAALLLEIVRGVQPATNIPAALLTGYLVLTAWITVRPPATMRRSAPGDIWIAANSRLSCLPVRHESSAPGTRLGK